MSGALNYKDAVVRPSPVRGVAEGVNMSLGGIVDSDAYMFIAEESLIFMGRTLDATRLSLTTNRGVGGSEGRSSGLSTGVGFACDPNESRYLAEDTTIFNEVVSSRDGDSSTSSFGRNVSFDWDDNINIYRVSVTQRDTVRENGGAPTLSAPNPQTGEGGIVARDERDALIYFANRVETRTDSDGDEFTLTFTTDFSNTFTNVLTYADSMREYTTNESVRANTTANRRRHIVYGEWRDYSSSVSRSEIEFNNLELRFQRRASGVPSSDMVISDSSARSVVELRDSQLAVTSELGRPRTTTNGSGSDIINHVEEIDFPFSNGVGSYVSVDELVANTPWVGDKLGIGGFFNGEDLFSGNPGGGSSLGDSNLGNGVSMRVVNLLPLAIRVNYSERAESNDGSNSGTVNSTIDEILPSEEQVINIQPPVGDWSALRVFNLSIEVLDMATDGEGEEYRSATALELACDIFVAYKDFSYMLTGFSGEGVEVSSRQSNDSFEYEEECRTDRVVSLSQDVRRAIFTNHGVEDLGLARQSFKGEVSISGAGSNNGNSTFTMDEIFSQGVGFDGGGDEIAYSAELEYIEVPSGGSFTVSPKGVNTSHSFEANLWRFEYNGIPLGFIDPEDDDSI